MIYSFAKSNNLRGVWLPPFLPQIVGNVTEMICKEEMKKMTGNEMDENDLDNWDGFLGSFLSVEDIKDEAIGLPCVAVEIDQENDRPIVVLEQNGAKKKFSLNVTNSKFVSEAGISKPKLCLGKVFFFRKSMAYSPSAKKEVPTLRIAKIDDPEKKE